MYSYAFSRAESESENRFTIRLHLAKLLGFEKKILQKYFELMNGKPQVKQ
jgi:hypothetical protein